MVCYFQQQNSVSGNGNRYFDIKLQIGETDTQAIRVMIAANDTKRQTFVTVLVTQRIYSRLHSFTQYFVFTAFDMHRFTTLAKKHEGTTTRESRDARNTNAGYPRGTITSQVCSASYLVYPSECNGL